eukprot:TRINITY_DN611_c0_g1_i1.p1 TRINITY_DN611_c0_g1~~TRINITY_DN611_c0_g1_i1.p1  ORF type:complete len:1240 (+),score=438.53 TRINITY_DN611_c0_g1_i1:253-3972(+)
MDRRGTIAGESSSPTVRHSGAFAAQGKKKESNTPTAISSTSHLQEKLKSSNHSRSQSVGGIEDARLQGVSHQRFKSNDRLNNQPLPSAPPFSDNSSMSSKDSPISSPAATIRVFQSKITSPLPPGWEMAYNAKGRAYFIDHNTERTTFEDPRLTYAKQQNQEEESYSSSSENISTLSTDNSIRSNLNSSSGTSLPEKNPSSERVDLAFGKPKTGTLRMVDSEKRKNKDSMLVQLKTARSDVQKNHKSNRLTAVKQKEQREKSVASKHAADIKAFETQLQSEMKSVLKDLELKQKEEMKKMKSKWKKEAKQEEGNLFAKNGDVISKEILSKQANITKKEKEMELTDSQLSIMAENQSNLNLGTQKRIMEEKMKQLSEWIEMDVDSIIRLHQQDREAQRKFHEYTAKMMQRGHAVDRAEMEEQQRKEQEHLKEALSQQLKIRTKEFKSQEKIRMKDQEKEIKLMIKADKHANKKDIQIQYKETNEKLQQQFFSGLAKQHKEEEERLLQRQSEQLREMKEGQHEFEQKKTMEFLNYDIESIEVFSQRLQDQIEKSRAQAQKMLVTEYEKMIPLPQTQFLEQSNKTEMLKDQLKLFISSQFTKLFQQFEKELEKDASKKDKKMTRRNTRAGSTDMDDARNARFSSQKKWEYETKLHAIYQNNYHEIQFLKNRRKLLITKQKQELDVLVEMYYGQEEILEEFFFQIVKNHLQLKEKEHLDVIAFYQNYLDNPISIPLVSQVDLVTEMHQQGRSRQSLSFQSSKAKLEQQHQEEIRIIDDRIQTLATQQAEEEENIRTAYSEQMAPFTFQPPKSPENRNSQQDSFLSSRVSEITAQEPPDVESDDEIIQSVKQPEDHNSSQPEESRGSISLDQKVDEEDIPPPAYEEVERQKLIALYNFTARKSNQLELKKGDIIEVISTNESGWWKGRVGDRSGKFPSNFCKPYVQSEQQESDHSESETTESESERTEKDQSDDEKQNEQKLTFGVAIAMYDYSPQDENELKMKKGDKIVILEEGKDKSWLGRLNGVEGKFPINYCFMEGDVHKMNELMEESTDFEDRDHSEDEEEGGEVEDLSAQVKGVLMDLDYLDQGMSFDLGDLKNEFLSALDDIQMPNDDNDDFSEDQSDDNNIGEEPNVAPQNDKSEGASSESEKTDEKTEEKTESEEDEENKEDEENEGLRSFPALSMRIEKEDESGDEEKTEQFFNYQKELELAPPSYSQATKKMGEEEYLDRIKRMLEDDDSDDD